MNEDLGTAFLVTLPILLVLLIGLGAVTFEEIQKSKEINETTNIESVSQKKGIVNNTEQVSQRQGIANNKENLYTETREVNRNENTGVYPIDTAANILLPLLIIILIILIKNDSNKKDSNKNNSKIKLRKKHRLDTYDSILK